MKSEELITLTLPYYTGEDRTVRVYMPERGEGERLPVIYMTDGQNLFDDDRPQQFGCWYTREAVREERKISGRAAVIVGIHNDGGNVRRTSELTPGSIGEVCLTDEFSPEEIRQIKPEGESFDRFVVDSVIPEIEKRFPVERGRNGAAFCGSSSGGLQAFFTAVSHPEKFCMSGVFSPAFLLYKSGDILRWTAERMREKMPYLYIYSGAGDKLEKRIFNSTDEVYDALCEFYPFDLLNEIILPEEPHHEKAWAQVFRDFLHTFLQRRNGF